MYIEKKIGPLSRLGTNRYNLIIAGLIYPILGSLFYAFDESSNPRGAVYFGSFLVLGALSLAAGMATFRSCWMARQSTKAFFILQIVFSLNFTRIAAIHAFTAPYFAWSLLGPFASAVGLVVYGRYSLIVIYIWAAYTTNIIAGAYLGTGTLIYAASNVLVLLGVLPILTTVLRRLRYLKERRIFPSVAAALEPTASG